MPLLGTKSNRRRVLPIGEISHIEIPYPNPKIEVPLAVGQIISPAQSCPLPVGTASYFPAERLKLGETFFNAVGPIERPLWFVYGIDVI